MAQDKFTAVWVSHTSISDFLACPRAYYLRNVYRNPKTGNKIKLINPSLSLGQAVHEVVESLSVLPTDTRFSQPLSLRFDAAWARISGRKGGFTSKSQEVQYKERGRLMISRIAKNPGPLKNLAVKIKMDLPYFWLSEENNIILCGKIDWLEYLPEVDGVHIIDFKTGKGKEKEESLQLPIYHLLVHHCQKRHVHKASYWYLEHSDTLAEKPLPKLEKAREKVLKIAKQIRLARLLERFKCPHADGCFACLPYEAIIRGEAEFVGVNEIKQDLFILEKSTHTREDESVIL